jgi:beta-aspartyl-dipeptidase (metallo-type)
VKFWLIEGGRLRTPAPGGVQSILIAGERIARVGSIDPRALDVLGVEYERINANNCEVWPGLIDVHEHLIGGSGESGWGTQTPEITLAEIVSAGITTVVGCLGTDTITRTMPALLARAKGLNASGITARIWSGGYDVPPQTLTGSVRRDLVLVEEVIGAGEISIADHRSTAPTVEELARIVKDAHVGGLLTGKAGVTHFHVGEENRRLADLRQLLDDWDIEPDWIYPTHVERTEALMHEAIDLSRRGVTVDVDVIEKDLLHWLRFFLDHGGDPAHFTASSDAAISSPTTLFDQVRECIVDGGLPVETVLPLVTRNPAKLLKLDRKARIEAGADADLLILTRSAFEIRDVFARGKPFVRDGSLVAEEKFVASSNRRVEWKGGRH